MLSVFFGFFCLNYFANLPSLRVWAAPGAAQASAVLKTAENCASKEECEALLDSYEKLLLEYNADIKKTEGQKKTLKNQIALLQKKSQSLSVEIKKSNMVITDLTMQISDTAKSVQETEEQIKGLQANLAQILRTIDEEDQKPLIELLIAEARLSNFFDDIIYLENLNEQSSKIIQDVKILKASLEDQKIGLEGDKEDIENEVKIQTLQKSEHEKNQKEQEKTLKLTEAEYQKTLTQKQITEKKVAAIKARIFEMAGLTTAAPSFGEAYEIAKFVSGVTGVRPAMILAILTQESNIGKNVGKCYLPKDAAVNQAKRIMQPTRDVPNFLIITAESGRDPYATAISCPMSFGWGGAMGPAQFIPSTWMNYRDRIKAITGKPADPWNIRDAFLATGLYLSDYGAKSQTYDGEWKAAMIYFSGSTNKKYRFYGDNALKIAAGYADDIAAIEGK